MPTDPLRSTRSAMMIPVGARGLMNHPTGRTIPSGGGLALRSSLRRSSTTSTGRRLLLAPYLKVDYHWSNTDYAYLVIAFRFAYSIGQTVLGRLIDRISTPGRTDAQRRGTHLVSILTPLANGFYSFGFFRFLLGAGESANWPAATKAVSEWFPKHERGLATASLDSGSSVGGAIAPFIVLWIYFRWGWRPAFAVPGCLGLSGSSRGGGYLSARTHPRVSTPNARCSRSTGRMPNRPGTRGCVGATCCRFRKPGASSSRRHSPIRCGSRCRLVSHLSGRQRHRPAKRPARSVGPFIAADLGNFVGGGVSGYLIKQGWFGAARKAVVVFGGIGMTLLIPTILTTNLYVITALLRSPRSATPRSAPWPMSFRQICLSGRSGSHGQRFERNRSRPGHHRGVPLDWPLLRSPAGFDHARVRSHRHRRRAGSAGRSDAGLAAGAEHGSDRSWIGSPDLESFSLLGFR